MTKLSDREIRILSALPDETEGGVATDVFEVEAMSADDVADQTGIQSQEVELLRSLLPQGLVTRHPQVADMPDRY